jgi:YidC/Oxa1 family membrane protein insertase
MEQKEPKDPKDRYRFLIALILSLVVFMAWPVAMRYFNPQPQPETVQRPETATPAPGPTPQQQASPGKPPVAAKPAQVKAAVPPVLPTQASPRDVTVKTPYFHATISNRGGVITSWIIDRYRHNGEVREISAATGGPLELVPQDAIQTQGAPFRFDTPSSVSIADQLNQAYFQVEGVNSGADVVELQEGEQREITFSYASGNLVARKSFKFYGERFVFDTAVSVTTDGALQPVELVIGPRIGDQTDKQTGSYSTPPQVIAYRKDEKREAVLAAKITAPFAKITQIDSAARRIDIDKPLAGDVDRIKLVSADGKRFLGYSRVVDRENQSHALILDGVPSGIAVGDGVGQAIDTLREGYRWAGIADHYFAMVAVPREPLEQIVLTNIQQTGGDNAVRDYPSLAVPAPPDSVIHIFVGPKDRELLEEASRQTGANLTALIDYGMFAIMLRPLVPLIGVTLEGLARMLHNYGWAIVVMTALINIALSPLRWFSSKKMKAAAKHQPRMKELQERLKKLKENPKKSERELQQLQQEQLDLMKEANPLGGCLPLLLQMPIFWSFFVYLTISLDVRRAPWIGWIKDLSTPDPYKILPIIMCVTMIAQTKLTPQPASADPSMKMQRVMMTWLMPIMLTWFFFFSAPSGLVLYWMISNVVGVLIQVIINKLTTEAASEGTGGDGGGVAVPATTRGTKSSRQKTDKVAVVRKQRAGKEIVEGAK